MQAEEKFFAFIPVVNGHRAIELRAQHPSHRFIEPVVPNRVVATCHRAELPFAAWGVVQGAQAHRAGRMPFHHHDRHDGACWDFCGAFDDQQGVMGTGHPAVGAVVVPWAADVNDHCHVLGLPFCAR